MRTYRFVATALLFTAIGAQAANDLASAFKEGKFNGRIRAQYFYTDWDMKDGTNKDDSAKGLALGGSLLYKSAPFYGVSFGVGLYTTQNPFGITDEYDGRNKTNPSKLNATTSNDLFLREGAGAKPLSGTNPDNLATYGTGYAVLAQSYLELSLYKSKLTAGRFLMTNPWINPNDTKMIPLALEGFATVSNDLPNTTLTLHYADKVKERGMTHFGNMADTGDTPDAIKSHYTTTYSTDGKHGDAPGVLVAGIVNKSINDLELQGWVMHWNDLVTEGMIEANYAVEAGDMILTLGGRFLYQDDQGAGTIIKPKIKNGDDDDSIDTFLIAARAIANYGPAKFLVAASHTDEGGDVIAPWRGFPTQGYTRSMTQTDWNADTNAYKLQFDYDFHGHLPGLKAQVSYSIYDRNPIKRPYQPMTNRGFQNDDTTQINLDVKYKFAGSLKGLDLLVRLMDQKNDIDRINENGSIDSKVNWDSSNQEMRIELNYRF
ncbi:MAG: OprD family porin [Campylobacterales bacterium]